MAGRLNAKSKGWQNFSKPVGGLQAYDKNFNSYGTGRIKSLADDDECIYYPVRYGKEDKVKIMENPSYACYDAPERKSKNVKVERTKAESYEANEEGIYEVLRCTVAQPLPTPPPFTIQLGNRNCLAPVPRSVLRALNSDLHQDRGRVLTFEPNSCRHQSPLFAKNNNYERATKYSDGNHQPFVSPHFERSLNAEARNNDELLDYCTCMCVVKGAFYHFTKDSDDEGHLADKPCSCAGPMSQCLPRWGCLGLFALFLPCLWCYPPIKGCKKLINFDNCTNGKKPILKQPK